MTENGDQTSPLAEVEARLRDIIPAKLYAEVWINPSVRNLTRVFNHMRTLNRILYSYLPRDVISSNPKPGVNRFVWDEGTLMFTDLAGFTPMLETTAGFGKEGAQSLLNVLNEYFREMIQIIVKAGGNLLEFTGDALLAQFPVDQRKSDTTRAVHAGLRMQRAMKEFGNVEIMEHEFKIGMRIGIHPGRYLTADIGTPHRMEHVLLGNCVLRAKQAEGEGKVGFVCLTPEAHSRLGDDFRYQDIDDGFKLVVDDLSEEELGDYDILPPKTRMASMVLFDTSREGLITAIKDSLDKVEPLASFIPQKILGLLVENAAARSIPPDFPNAVLMFINLLGLPEDLESLPDEDQEMIISEFSRIISLINAEIETQGGVMKKVTYHHSGPDIMAFFGTPEAHTNDALRAATAAREIQKVVKGIKPLKIGDETYKLESHTGVTLGQVFAAEFGDPQGRREFNVLGNTVNTAARLMNFAEADQVVLSEDVYKHIKEVFETEKFKDISLKGRSKKFNLYELGKPKK